MDFTPELGTDILVRTPGVLRTKLSGLPHEWADEGWHIDRLLDRFAELRRHLGQIEKAMADQYADAVGPWRAFLPFIDAP